MAEYDAFGRKIGENPLEQLSGDPAPQAPVSSPAPPSGPPPAKRSHGAALGAIAVSVVVLAVIGVVGALIAGFSSEPAIEPVVTPRAGAEEEQSGEPVPAPAGQAEPETADSQPPAGLEPRSLIRRDRLERALKAMRIAELGTPTTFRLAPDRIDVQLKTSKGRLRLIQVREAGVPREVTIGPPGFDSVPTFPWRAIRPGAPQRLVRAAAERSGLSAADVNYLVLMPLTEPTWGVFFKDGTHFQGDADGRVTRKVS